MKLYDEIKVTTFSLDSVKNYGPLVEAAKIFATEASQLVAGSQIERLAIRTKSTENDMVTDVDRATETFLIEAILSRFPNDTVIGEENGERYGNSGRSWIIDPIDGTTNFVYGFPAYSVSIGVKEDDDFVAGAVFNIPESTLYWAGKEMGAFKNGSPIRVRPPIDHTQALIGTGFGYSSKRRMSQSKFLSTIIGEIRDIRRAGAASLDLCYVAEGRLDGYYESGLWPWDYTAATLIVREAGGIVRGLDGPEPTPSLTVATSNLPLSDFLTERIRPHIPFED